jgi:hypothetical protein
MELLIHGNKMSFIKIYINISIKSYIIIYIYFLLFAGTSCSKMIFSDEELSRQIFTGHFSDVTIDGTFDIILIQDSANMVIARGKNKINAIEAECIDNLLRIKDNSKFPVEPGRNTIELHLTEIKHLVTYGPVFLTTSDTLHGDRISWDGIGEIAEARLLINCNLFVFCNSANTLGNIDLIGKATSLDVFNRYGGNVFADSLECRYAEITNESIGDVHVNVSVRLEAYIWGPGNIYYRGDPRTDIREIKGTGKLIKIR